MCVGGFVCFNKFEHYRHMHWFWLHAATCQKHNTFKDATCDGDVKSYFLLLLTVVAELLSPHSIVDFPSAS